MSNPVAVPQLFLSTHTLISHDIYSSIPVIQRRLYTIMTELV